MKTHCTKLTDAEVMQVMMEVQDFDKEGCLHRCMMTVGDMHEVLESRGYILLLIHTMEFAKSLSICQLCKNYKGPYPEIDKICVKKEEKP